MCVQQLPDGVYAASLTPLHTEGSIAQDVLITHIRWLMASGCRGVVLMGTTGEANSLTTRERMVALDAVVESGIPANRLMIGTGCCTIADTVMLTRHALHHGVGGILMLPPFYYKNVQDEGLFNFFDQVIQKTGTEALHMYLYHFPQMTAVPFTEGLLRRLLKTYPDTIVGMKDSSGDWAHMQRTRCLFPDFRVFSGTERYLSDILRIGGAGCISATANVTCSLAHAVFEDPCTRTQEYLDSIRTSIEAFPMIAALKHLLAHVSGDPVWLHMHPPQVALSQEQGVLLLKRMKNFLSDFHYSP